MTLEEFKNFNDETADKDTVGFLVAVLARAIKIAQTIRPNIDNGIMMSALFGLIEIAQKDYQEFETRRQVIRN